MRQTAERLCCCIIQLYVNLPLSSISVWNDLSKFHGFSETLNNRPTLQADWISLRGNGGEGRGTSRRASRSEVASFEQPKTGEASLSRRPPSPRLCLSLLSAWPAAAQEALNFIEIMIPSRNGEGNQQI